jgi:hypothetical protein
MNIKTAFSVFGLSMLVAIYLGFGASAEQKLTYPMSVDEVNQIIDEIALPEMVFANHAHNTTHWRENNRTSVWALQTSDGQEMLRLVATTSIDKTDTLVVVTLGPPEAEKREEMQKLLDANPAYRDLYVSALAEQIDATLGKRPFAIANLARATTRVAVQASLNRAAMSQAIDDDYERRSQEERSKYDQLYKNR